MVSSSCLSEIIACLRSRIKRFLATSSSQLMSRIVVIHGHIHTHAYSVSESIFMGTKSSVSVLSSIVLQLWGDMRSIYDEQCP